MADYYGIHSITAVDLGGPRREGDLAQRAVRTGPTRGKALAVAVDMTASPKTTQPKPKKRSGAEQGRRGFLRAKSRRDENWPRKCHPARNLTDNQGKFRVKAKFRGIASEVVKLRFLEDAPRLSVPLEKLSDDDQECIRQRKY